LKSEKAFSAPGHLRSVRDAFHRKIELLAKRDPNHQSWAQIAAVVVQSAGGGQTVLAEVVFYVVKLRCQRPRFMDEMVLKV
jgi:hypothetical protein